LFVFFGGQKKGGGGERGHPRTGGIRKRIEARGGGGKNSRRPIPDARIARGPSLNSKSAGIVMAIRLRTGDAGPACRPGGPAEKNFFRIRHLELMRRGRPRCFGGGPQKDQVFESTSKRLVSRGPLGGGEKKRLADGGDPGPGDCSPAEIYGAHRSRTGQNHGPKVGVSLFIPGGELARMGTEPLVGPISPQRLASPYHGAFSCRPEKFAKAGGGGRGPLWLSPRGA